MEGKKKQELSLDELEMVSGAGYLQDLLDEIRASGHASKYKELLKNQGKAAASAECCKDHGPLCGFCAAAITML